MSGLFTLGLVLLQVCTCYDNYNLPVYVLYICIYSSSSSAVFNVVTPSGKQATMKKAACFKMALWLASYNEFFAKSVSAKSYAQSLFIFTMYVNLQ